MKAFIKNYISMSRLRQSALFVKLKGVGKFLFYTDNG